MRNKLILIIFLIFSIQINALTLENIAACRQGSTTYNTYATALDKFLVQLTNRHPLGSSEFIKEIKFYIRMHEDFKDKEYTKLMQVQQLLIAERKQSVDSIESWRMIMEATIDEAYNAVGENLKSNQLGRSEEHYQRKIYEFCTSSK